MNRTIDPADDRKVEKIKEDEVLETMKQLKKRKATRPDEILEEELKTLGRTGKMLLTSVFWKTMETKKMPDDWRCCNLILIFKNLQNRGIAQSVKASTMHAVDQGSIHSSVHTKRFFKKWYSQLLC